MPVQEVQNCWKMADEHIVAYKEELTKALSGAGTATPAVCWDMINFWLEYRFSHGPEDDVGGA